MPKLWDETIDAHRRAVHDAALDAVADLVASQGLRAVTMTRVAEATGLGRATLYRYFEDVDAILLAWHERQVESHLHQLAALRDQEGDPAARLDAVLEAYALIQYEHRGGGLAVPLHAGAHVARAQEHLSAFITELLAEGAESGVLRRDIPAAELASYCLHSLNAASTLRSRAAVRRLVAVTVGALRREA